MSAREKLLRLARENVPDYGSTVPCDPETGFMFMSYDEYIAHVGKLLDEYAHELAERMSGAEQPFCPVCGIKARRARYWLKDPDASVFERVVVTLWAPCGHESESVPKASVGPVRPGEEPTT